MSTHTGWILGVAGLALATAAPVAQAQGRERERDTRGQLERDAFTWAGKIPQGRWIMVRNLSGPIEVRPGTGDRVEVRADRRTLRGDPGFVRFEVQKFGAGGQDVLVCALWGDNSSCDEDGYRSRGGVRNRENSVMVSFVVLVPKGVKVAAHTVNGETRVEGVASEVDASSVNGSVYVSTLSGPVRANTVNGSVRASMGKFDLESDLEFTSVNGSVVAEFPGDIDANVDLTTVNGRFLTDYAVTISGRIDPRHLRATIGKGGPKLRLSTVNGNVELRKR